MKLMKNLSTNILIHIKSYLHTTRPKPLKNNKNKQTLKSTQNKQKTKT